MGHRRVRTKHLRVGAQSEAWYRLERATAFNGYTVRISLDRQLAQPRGYTWGLHTEAMYWRVDVTPRDRVYAEVTVNTCKMYNTRLLRLVTEIMKGLA